MLIIYKRDLKEKSFPRYRLILNYKWFNLPVRYTVTILNVYAPNDIASEAMEMQ